MKRQNQDSSEKNEYTAYPFQVIEYPSGIILRRGISQILLEGEEAIPSILMILNSSSGGKVTKQAILDLFPPFRHNAINSLLNELIDKRFLIDVKKLGQSDILNETNSDVFYWQLGKTPNEINKLFAKKKVFVFGENRLSTLLKTSISDNGFVHVEVIPYGPLNSFTENTHEIKDQTEYLEDWKNKLIGSEDIIIIGASEYGGQILLLELNAFCLNHGMHFIPVNIDNMKAQVGPLVIPHQTACLQCLRARQNAHLHNIELERYAEASFKDGQQVAGTHISIIRTAAEITAFELARAYGNIIPNYHPSLIEIDLLNANTSSKLVLKVPRCSACSSLTQKTSILTKKPTP